MDYLGEGRTSVVVGVLSNLPIIDQEVKEDGSFASCTLDTDVGSVNYGLFYAPNERARRKDLWNWMATTLHERNWILFGDWNMVDLFDDSVGASARIHGSEERSWRRVVNKFDLIDLYLTVG